MHVSVQIAVLACLTGLRESVENDGSDKEVNIMTRIQKRSQYGYNTVRQDDGSHIKMEFGRIYTHGKKSREPFQNLIESVFLDVLWSF